VDRLRAHVLLDTAAPVALEMRSPPPKLPDGMPMFLQRPKTPGVRHARV
jgi:hypothetical protein